MDGMETARTLRNELEQSIAELPDDFYSKFQDKTSGYNPTHSITVAIISRIVHSMRSVRWVGIRPHFQRGYHRRFRPDVAGFDERFKPVLTIDYQNQTSSDARVPLKCWEWYTDYFKGEEYPPFIIITTLPSKPSRSWGLLNCSSGQYNYGVKEHKNSIKANPKAFWYGFYRKIFNKMSLPESMVMMNIDGKTVSIEDLGARA